MASRIGSLMRLRDVWLQGFTSSRCPDLQMPQGANPSSLQTICCHNVHLFRLLEKRPDELGFIAASWESSIAFSRRSELHRHIPTTLPKLRHVPVARTMMVCLTRCSELEHEAPSRGSVPSQV